MNKTREEFIRRWRTHLAGMAVYGIVSEIKEGPLVRANKWFEIPEQVEKLLGQMYDDLAPKDRPLPVKVNGAKT